jgi:hypothetical protein
MVLVLAVLSILLKIHYLVMGLDWDNLGKDVVGNRRLANDRSIQLPGIYTTSFNMLHLALLHPHGVGDSTKWKFRAYP